MLLSLSSALQAAERVEIAPGQVASLENGRDLYLEAAPQRSEGLLAFTRRLCGDETSASGISAANRGVTKLLMGVRYRIPFELLQTQYQLQVIRALFREDRPTPGGWEHVLVPSSSGAGGFDRVALWFTGNSANGAALADYNRNAVDRVVIPPHLLRPNLRAMLPEAPPEDLAFGQDGKGKYAVYRLRPGEALYSAVVVRFTGNVYADDVNALASEIAARSGIRDVTDIPIGYQVKVPLEVLLPEFLPIGDPRRVEYEQGLLASSQRVARPRLVELDGVTVILDAGHGGKDVGASMGGVWESLYVYDIMLRTKRILEEQTSATVVPTTRDGQRFQLIEKDILPYSRGHRVLTNPNYLIEDSSVSAHLRWYLANSVYRRKVAQTKDPNKVMFLSIHADSLHSSLRGAMVYIPGAKYRGGSYGKSGSVYARRQEVKEAPRVSFARSDLNRSEGLSRELAERLLASFREEGLKIHEFKPIREKVIRNRRSWVPAVLRYNNVPAEALLEVCNLANPEDRRLIKTQQYRERVAEAIVRGILAYYGHEGGTTGRVAAAR